MRIVLIAAAAALFCLCPFPSAAAEPVYTEQFDEEIRSFTDALPEELRDEWHDALSAPSGTEKIQKQISVSGLLERITDAAGGAWRSAGVLFLRGFSYLLIAALFSVMRSSANGGTLSAACSLCSSLCMALLLADLMSVILTESTEYIHALASLSAGIAPLSCAVLAASGRISAAASGNAALMLLYALFQNVSSALLLPLSKLSLCFAMVGCAVPGTRLETIAAAVRRFFAWAMALVALLVTFVTGAQQVIAQSADSLTIRTVKFSLGNFIPMVGGALSDALGTAAGSLALIKNVCGIFGAAATVALMLPTAIHLLLMRSVLGILHWMADTLGCERAGVLLREINGTLGCILAVTAIVSFLFLFVLGMLISLHI